MRTQLQILMANLEVSERSEFSMPNFCFSYKQMNDSNDMAETNTGQQKDAYEFLQQFTAKLDNDLVDTSRKYMLTDTFGFDMCTQLICNNCKRTKNNVHEEKMLNIEVKDFNDIEESI